MGHISEARLQMVRGLIEQAPDAAIHDLSASLSNGGHDDGLRRVRSLVEAEAADRRLRNQVLAPVAPFCAAPNPFTTLSFPPRTLSLLWKALEAAAPDEVASAGAMLRQGRLDTDRLDALCAQAAAGVRGASGGFEAAAASADAGAGRSALAACLDIAPLARAALTHVPDWLGRMTEEKAAQLRLTYRDVVSVSEDAGPMFFEMLAAHLAEPWLILRVVSGIMDHPPEAYLSASELAAFAIRAMDDIDRRLAQAGAFQASGGRQAARDAAQVVHTIAVEIAECEQSIQLAHDGPWGRRVAQQKRRLAALVEGHLSATEDAVAHALPVQAVRRGAKALHALPRLNHDPDAGRVDKAATLLTLLAEVRSSAAAGGFAAARARTLEAVDSRLDAYVEDLLEELRSGGVGDVDRARAFIDIAAEFCGLIRDQQAAQIVRRRAAAAAA
jgi:hypothetical protein